MWRRLLTSSHEAEAQNKGLGGRPCPGADDGYELDNMSTYSTHKQLIQIFR